MQTRKKLSLSYHHSSKASIYPDYGAYVLYKLKDGSVEIGDQLTSPLINLVPAQIVLSPDDLARSAEILAVPVRVLYRESIEADNSMILFKTGNISRSQFDTLKELLDAGVAQTQIVWVGDLTLILDRYLK